MLLLALLAAQPAPDIELNIHATAREVRVRQRGETSLQVHATPDANSRVEVARPRDGGRGHDQKTVDIHAEARIANPATNLPPAETSGPN
jgi:hypothetical protein